MRPAFTTASNSLMPGHRRASQRVCLSNLSVRLFTERIDYWSSISLPSELPSLSDASFWFSGFWTSWRQGDAVIFASGSFDTFSACEPFPGGGSTGGCFPGPGPFPAPEPGTLALLGLCVAGLAFTRRRKQ